MSSTVYIETSIIGYLASRPSRDLITAANQRLTHDWWNEHRESFDIFISQFVIDECKVGDESAVKERLEMIADIRQLDVTGAVGNFAEVLVQQVPLPQKAQVDALHIAIATVHGVAYLLTWNCTHRYCVLRSRQFAAPLATNHQQSVHHKNSWRYNHVA